MKSMIHFLAFSVALLLSCAAIAAGIPADASTPHAALGALPAIAFGGLVVNSANLKDLFVGFQAIFKKGQASAKAYWDQVATLVPSTTKENHYAWLGQFPKLREWLGVRHIKQMEAHDYRVKNKKFESTVGIGRDDMDDDTYGVYNPLIQEMGYASETHPDELVFGLMANGFAEKCYDGQNFFDTDHPVGTEGAEASVSNMQAGGSAPWFLLDTRRPLKPFIFQKRRDYDFKSMTKDDDEGVFMRDEFRYGVDARVNVGFGFWQQAFGSKATLDETNFDAAYDAMLAFKSDEGRPLGIMPSVLVVGPSNRKKAMEIVKVSRLANGEDNANKDIVDVLVVPWLT